MVSDLRATLARRAASARAPSFIVGVLAAVETFWRSIGAVLRGGDPWYDAILLPAAALAIFAAGTFLLCLVGAGWWDDDRGNVVVSPWFAGFVIGGLVSFFVGLFATQRGWWGLAAVGAWTFLLLIARIVRQLSNRRAIRVR